MSDLHLPTEQELDLLLDQQPQFDLDAVKRRTLSHVEGAGAQPAKRRLPLRGILIAAVLCALSISAVAAADWAADGRIFAALGIGKPQAEAVSVPEPAEEPLPRHVPKPAAPAPAPAPKEEPPELDAQVAEALRVDQAQAQKLRPAVQTVDRTVEDQDVRMSVLQTLGDDSCLYIKLRFDFPKAVPYSDQLQFKTFGISFGDLDGYSWTRDILEQTETSVTSLLFARVFDLESLTGKTVTVTVQDYGTPHRYTEDEVLHLAGDAGKPYTSIIRPDGSVDWEVTAEKLAALPGESEPLIVYSEGFTVSRRADGSRVVTYDGAHGDQLLDAYLVPDFDPVIAGTWEQSWQLSYQDLSLGWTGAAGLFDPALTITRLQLSPLSWKADFTAAEDVPEGETLNFNLIPKDWNVRLRRRDGSAADLPLHWSGGSGSSPVPGEAGLLVTDITVGAVFDQPIDLSDVTAVIIDETEFPLS